MKKFTLFTANCMRRLSLVAFLFMVTITASAYNFEVDGICYSIYDSGNKQVYVDYKSSDYNCYSGDVVIPSTITCYGETYDVVQIGDRAFLNCTTLTSITLPEGMLSILYAFYNCTSLVDIYCLGSTPAKTADAFDETTYENATLHVPAGCSDTYATTNYWSKFSNIEEFNDGSVDIDFTSFNVDGIDYIVTNTESLEVEVTRGSYSGDVVIPSKVKYEGITFKVISVGDKAFYNCTSLTSVDIPEGVTSIGNHAFYSCTSLTSVSLPSTLTEIISCAFSSCKSLNAVYINDIESWCGITFESADANPVYNAGNLYLDDELAEDIIIPESVDSIRNYAFYGCTSLTSVNFGDNVVNIGLASFSDCTNLKRIEIGKSATEITQSAFNGCSNLTDVYIGENVSKIGVFAFRNCTSLNNIYCYATTPASMGSSVFADTTYESATLHVPVGCSDIYQSRNTWKYFYNIEEFDTTDILNLTSDGFSSEETARFSVDGQRLNSAQKGINIVRYSDGTIKKVIVQ